MVGGWIIGRRRSVVGEQEAEHIEGLAFLVALAARSARLVDLRLLLLLRQLVLVVAELVVVAVVCTVQLFYQVDHRTVIQPKHTQTIDA